MSRSWRCRIHALIIELVAYPVAKLLHFVGDGAQGIFAAGRSQQQPHPYAHADPNRQGRVVLR